MKYSAEIKSVIADYEAVNTAFVTVEYTDGTKVVSKDYRLADPRDLKTIIKHQIEDLERIDAVQDFIANPPLGPVVFEAPVETPEEAAARVMEEQRQKLMALKRDVDLGLVEATVLTAEVQTAKAVIEAVSVAPVLKEETLDLK